MDTLLLDSGLAGSGRHERMADPVETPKRLYREAAEGEDEATPAIVLGGVTLIIGIVVAVLVAFVFLVYFLA